MRITAAHALAVANERRIVDAFRSGHAVTNSMSRTLRALGLSDSPPLRLLVGSAVIRRAGPDRYFLDERTWASRRQLRVGTIGRLLFAVAAVAAAAALLL